MAGAGGGRSKGWQDEGMAGAEGGRGAEEGRSRWWHDQGVVGAGGCRSKGCQEKVEGGDRGKEARSAAMGHNYIDCER